MTIWKCKWHQATTKTPILQAKFILYRRRQYSLEMNELRVATPTNRILTFSIFGTPIFFFFFFVLLNNSGWDFKPKQGKDWKELYFSSVPKGIPYCGLLQIIVICIRVYSFNTLSWRTMRNRKKIEKQKIKLNENKIAQKCLILYDAKCLEY